MLPRAKPQHKWLTREREAVLPRQMDDNHLVNCIRLLEKRYINPCESAPIYNDMVLEAGDRGIAVGVVGMSNTEQKIKRAKERQNEKMIKWTAAFRASGPPLVFDGAIVDADCSLTPTKSKKKSKGKSIKKIKVVEVRVVDVRARRIILED